MAFARRRVLAIVDEQEVTVVALDTGEILSSLIDGTGATNGETPADGRGLGRPAESHVSPMSRLMTVARPTGVERADAINIRIPIEGRDLGLLAQGA